MFKRYKVVMLPTNEKAPIFKIGNWNKLYKCNEIVSDNIIDFAYDESYQNLYIISDDKIKDGEFDDLLEQGLYFESDNSMIKIITTRRVKTIGMYKKIIATTDTTIKVKSEQAGDNRWVNPYLKPSDSFISKYIEEYNKGNVITDVMVEYEQKRIYGDELDIHGHNIEIVKVNPKYTTITIKKVKDSWSREEVHNLMMQAWIYGESDKSMDYTIRERWIEKMLDI